jgi:signal transduction histidine kinase
MKTPFWLKTVLCVWLVLFPAYPVVADGITAYANPQTRDLVALVEAAAAAVHQKGEEVFPDFRREGGRWFQADRYIFVWDLQGNRYVYPPDPEHERGNFLDLKDVGGKSIGRMIVAIAAEGAGKGWVHYQWTRPHKLDPEWKSTYIVRAVAPSGKVYLVGSGIYRAGMEEAFIIEEVEAAAALLQQEGQAAFVTLRDPNSRFFFHDTYIFVITSKGIELVNPAFPALEGRNLWDIQDVNGKYIVQEFADLALKKGAGWVTYYWPRPDAPQMPVKKASYVKKVQVDDEVMIVGAGMYE